MAKSRALPARGEVTAFLLAIAALGIAISGCARSPSPLPPATATPTPAPTPPSPVAESPAPASSAQQVERVGGEVSEPVELSRVRLQVPAELQRKTADWHLVLEAVIQPDGSVTQARSLRPVAAGSEPCVAFIARQLEKSRYKPAMASGKAVPVALTFSILHCPCCKR